VADGGGERRRRRWWIDGAAARLVSVAVMESCGRGGGRRRS